MGISSKNIEEIPETQNLIDSNLTIIDKQLKKIDINIAKKSKIINLNNLYETENNIDSIIDNLKLKLDNKLGLFLKYEDMANTYCIKSNINKIKFDLLNKEYAKSSISRHSKKYDVKAMCSRVYDYFAKTVEEMTDFAAAAAISLGNNGSKPNKDDNNNNK